jgi:phosphopantothenoylcysteine decarboxylase / phosphopantothenate---cysteine ligase
MTAARRVLLVIGGGIAAFKCLDIIRRLRRDGVQVVPVLTEAGSRFVTPLSVQALAEHTVYTDLWSLTDEHEMGHIQLSRRADLVMVAPASADLLARMAAGLADDLAATLLLATDKPVLVAPAMNVRMWQHAATTANLAVLRERGVEIIGPDEGLMACGEWGPGRMADPAAITAAILGRLASGELVTPAGLAGRHALVTSGPTREPIDPVRYLANHSSGRQGHAIAAALAALGARVTLVSGPVALPDPPDVTVRHVETAVEMLEACRVALPADIAVCAAAVADWRVAACSPGKLKKADQPPRLDLVLNPDILATLAQAGPDRPRLVVGFAAETGVREGEISAKRVRKGCDWLIANDVSPGTGVMGGDSNQVLLVTGKGAEPWPLMPKTELAQRLARRIADAVA